MSKHHLLKTLPEYFWSIALGVKTFELRVNDRDFKQGDTLNLAEIDPENAEYTGRIISCEVAYIMHGPKFGLQEGWVIMAIRPFASQPVTEEAEYR